MNIAINELATWTHVHHGNMVELFELLFRGITIMIIAPCTVVWVVR
jgi:hypothetical protein